MSTNSSTLVLPDHVKKPTFATAVVVTITLLGSMLYTILVLGAQAHIAVIFTFTVTCLILKFVHKFKWLDLMEYIRYSGTISMSPILIIMSIGVLISAWIASGSVPLIMYYGLLIVSPQAFLVTAFIVCCIVSITLGTSWGTGGTMGVALMGVAGALGIPPAMAAGAVISGAYFGDKMSPISDSTILASEIGGVNLFAHIKSMLATTVPSGIIAIIAYTILGMRFSTDAETAESVRIVMEGIQSTFNINVALLIPPLIIVVMAFNRLPSLATILTSTLAAVILAIIFQGQTLTTMADILYSGYRLDSGVAALDTLLSRGGLMSKMFTVSLALIAISFGGVLEKSGLLDAVMEKTKSFITSTPKLILAHIIFMIFLTFSTASQYMTIILGSRTFVNEYKKRGVAPLNCARTVEDGGTMLSSQVPWNSCGMFFTATLGVPGWVYVPYSFLNWLSPVWALIWGFTGKFIWTREEKLSTETGPTDDFPLEPKA
jgi:NhaC family Na+:H+ antiporter